VPIALVLAALSLHIETVLEAHQTFDSRVDQEEVGQVISEQDVP
jgi:hypothetical protein